MSTMSSVREDSDSWIRNVPAFSSLQFSGWKRNFLGSLPVNLSDMVTGGTVKPVAPANNASAAVRATFVVDSEIFRKNNHNLYRGLLASLLKSENSTLLPDEDVRCPMFDGLACLLFLDGIYNKKSSQNIYLAVDAVIKMRQNPSEDSQVYLIRLRAAFTRMVSLGTKMEDLLPILYLMTTDARYGSVREHLMLQAEQKSLDELSEALRSFEQRSVSSSAGASSESDLPSEQATAHVNLVCKRKASGPQVKISAESSHMMPTAHEKTLTCHICGKFGHAQRTCAKMRKKAERELKVI